MLVTYSTFKYTFNFLKYYIVLHDSIVLLVKGSIKKQ
jgi:hypothetical protein